MKTAHISNHPIVDPDTINDVPALRAALHAANKNLLAYALAIDERDKVGRDFLALINRVLLQHIVGDFRGVAAILDAQLEATPRLRQSLEDVRESKEARKLDEWISFAHAEFGREEMPSYNAGERNPWATKNIDELRQMLDGANRAGISALAQVEGFKRLIDDLSKEVSVIILANLQGDKDAVSRAVSEFCKKHVVDKRNGIH